MKIFRIILPLVVILVISCEPEENISKIPQVGFKSLDGPFLVDKGEVTLYGADLAFDFRDGDSDFGVDTIEHPKDTNLFIIPFRKVSGIYDSVDADLYGRYFTISEDSKLDRNGSIKGEIKVQITYLVRPPFDTIRYEFYIKDRAGNISNTGITTDFVW